MTAGSEVVVAAPTRARARLGVRGGRLILQRTELTYASDADLGRGLSAGDPAAARAAWDRFQPMVKRMLRRTLDRSIEIEDVAQAVFLCLFKRAHTLRDPSALKGFVIAITIRVAREEVRHRRRLSYRMLERGRDVDVIAVEPDAGAKHAIGILSNLIDRLRERERAVLLMRSVAGMAAAEVAAELGVSEPTARRFHSAAIKRIRKWARRDPVLVDYLGQPSRDNIG